MLRLFILVTAALMATSTAVSAQPQGPTPGRLYRGLFGSGLQNTNQALTVDATASGGYDNNVFTAQPTGTNPETVSTVRHGSFRSVAAGLNYRLRLSRVSLGVRVHGGISDNSARRNRPVVRNYRGDLTGSLPLWTGGSLAVNYGVTVQPFYRLPWLAGTALEEESLGSALEFDETTGTLVENHTNWSSAGFLTQNLTRRMSLSLGYMRQRSRSISGTREYLAQSGMGGVSVAIGKGLGVRLGYGISENRYDGQTLYRTNNIDFGLSYNRALSLTRRTRLSFNTGTTGVIDRGRTFYRLDADARLSRELARTWTAQLIYRRDVSFDDTLRQPAPLDAVSVGVAGMFSRRLGFNTNIGLVNGGLGFNTQGNHFETYYGRSALIVGLTRRLGVGMDYSYFRYRFDSQSVLPLSVSSRGDRQRIRAFLTFRAALFTTRNKGAR